MMNPYRDRPRPVIACAAPLALILLVATGASAQVAADTTGAVTTVVIDADSTPVPAAIVRSDRIGAQTDERGVATLHLAAGERRLIVGRFGFVPETLSVMVRAGLDTSITVQLEAQSAELAGVVVSATRSERRIEDEPLRVEVLAPEEVEEKLLMTPGDITMMLNETSGLRVQTTSPSLGGANVRVQGLRGRYTQILSDGLPLYGGQTGGLGLLQIPPMDLGGVEIIKGVASALYGGSALGGVINLTSRRPGADPVREMMLNQTTLGGTDVVAFLASRNPRVGLVQGSALGWTTLAGVHRQRQVDRDHDGWTDMPGYERVVIRPRAFWSTDGGHNAVFTAGFTGEDREGGSMPGETAPDGSPFPERLTTRRLDAGGVGRLVVGSAGIVSLRGSASVQRHQHTFGPTLERDRHLTWFGEAAYTVNRGTQTWVIGAALQQERYVAHDVDGFDYAHTVPGVFAQATVEPAEWLALTASGRVDRHSEYGTIASPRVSVLLRPAGTASTWTVRTSLGGGYFAPTPFIEETEVIGLSPLEPPQGLVAERAVSGSIDVGGTIGAVEVNGTVFGSAINHPTALRPVTGDPDRVELVNVDDPIRTTGGELLARWNPEPFHVTLSYTYVRARETDAENGVRRPVALTPRHQAGMVAAWEAEGAGRVGLEVYYTGRQALEDDPWRDESRPYVHVGVLVERHVGAARVFVNAENLLGTRQTRWDPLVRPARGLGGRWTNDVWGPLEGRVANVGVRWGLP